MTEEELANSIQSPILSPTPQNPFENQSRPERPNLTVDTNIPNQFSSTLTPSPFVNTERAPTVLEQPIVENQLVRARNGSSMLEMIAHRDRKSPDIPTNTDPILLFHVNQYYFLPEKRLKE